MPINWGKVDKTLLDSEFLFDVQRFLDNSPYNWYVTEGYRSMERSNRLYLEYKLLGGPKAAPGGKSAHNYGMAIDVVLDRDEAKPGLQPTWDIKLAGWGWLKTNSIPHPRLRNGWSFHDWPHIEKYKWLDYVSWRKNYEDNIRYLNEVIANHRSGVELYA